MVRYLVRYILMACAVAATVSVGIVVIPAIVSSPEKAKCTAERAAAAGIINFVPNDDENRRIAASFFDAAGNSKSIQDYQGTALLVNFWATWCAPCVAEMPALDRLQDLVSGSGIEVLAINEDRDGESVAPAFYETNKLKNLAVLYDRNQTFLRAAGVTGLPTTLLIDQDGAVKSAILGDTEWDSPDIVSFVQDCFGLGDA